MWAILYDFLSQSFSKRREQAEKFWSLTKRLPISMPVVVFLFLKMVLHFFYVKIIQTSPYFIILLKRVHKCMHQAV